MGNKTRRAAVGLCLAAACLTVVFGSGCAGGQQGTSAGSDRLVAEKSSVRATEYGDVVGVVSDGVEAYYNIPYGSDPTGDLRWHAPEAPKAWDGELDCSKSGKKALQMATVYDEDGNASVEQQGTTDCLNLDVYTSADAKDLPVLVYIHGGNNQTGTATEIGGSEVVARDDAVYVSLDYRLGLLGFNCLPALLDDENPSGNFALLDIAAGLKWVQDNIAEFGGDPDNVTVSGFSAGGRNVMAMLVSPIFEGLFDKAIAYSGGMTISDQDESAQAIARTIAPLAVEDGKADTDGAAAEWLLQDTDEVRDYLYGLDEGRLTALMSDAGIRMSAFPHLFGDGVVLPKDGFSGVDYVNDVPIIMLTGTDEFGMFCMNSPVYEELGDEGDAALGFATKYGSDLYRIFNTQTSAAAMDPSYQSDMYLMQVNYGNASSGVQIDGLDSFHGIFAPMFGSHNYDAFFDFSEPGYQAMADVFHGYLKSFLHAGTPNSEESEVEWPVWTMDSKQTLVLDATDDGKAAVAVEDVFKTPEQIIQELQADTSLSEDAKRRVVTEVMNGRWFSTLLDATYGTPQAVHLK